MLYYVSEKHPVGTVSFRREFQFSKIQYFENYNFETDEILRH